MHFWHDHIEVRCSANPRYCLDTGRAHRLLMMVSGRNAGSFSHVSHSLRFIAPYGVLSQIRLCPWVELSD